MLSAAFPRCVLTGSGGAPVGRAVALPAVLRGGGSLPDGPAGVRTLNPTRRAGWASQPPRRTSCPPRLVALAVDGARGAQQGAGGRQEEEEDDEVSSTMGENSTVSVSGGITPVQQMLASGTGALLTSLFVTPLDVVKIRLQAQRTPFSRVFSVQSMPWSIHQPKWKCFLYCNGLMDHLYVCQNGNGCTAWYKSPTRFTGTLDAFVKIIRYEGIRSLWSGLPPTLVMAVPATVIYFTGYDQLRDFLHAKIDSQGRYIPLVAGAIARLGAVTVISPLELIRTKMQSRPLSYRELRVCIQSSVAQDGWLSLWKGWGPTVLRDVPFSALYWYNYELVKAWLCSRLRLKEATFMVSFTAGAISGTVAAILTLPFDVVKTQRQIELGNMETLQVTASKSSTWLLMQKIWAESGTRGLFAGFLPRVIKVAPACAIMISTYEFGKSFFQKMNQEQRVSSL